MVQIFYKEFVPWRVLQHPNILSLLGVIMTKTKFEIVSEWMSNRNINQFVTAYHDVNRFKLVGYLFKFRRSPSVVDEPGSLSWPTSQET
jgi:hypothetical protein